eukprot:9630078-Alexandrium_andersonii.AAC.1
MVATCTSKKLLSMSPQAPPDTGSARVRAAPCLHVGRVDDWQNCDWARHRPASSHLLECPAARSAQQHGALELATTISNPPPDPKRA